MAVRDCNEKLRPTLISEEQAEIGPTAAAPPLATLAVEGQSTGAKVSGAELMEDQMDADHCAGTVKRKSSNMPLQGTTHGKKGRVGGCLEKAINGRDQREHSILTPEAPLGKEKDASPEQSEENNANSGTPAENYLETLFRDLEQALKTDLQMWVDRLDSSLTRTTGIAVKGASKDLSRVALKLQRTMAEIFEAWATLKTEKENEALTATKIHQPIRNNCVHCQTVRTRLDNGVTGDDLESILKEDWPKNTFRNVTVRKGGFIVPRPRRALILGDSDCEGSGLVRNLAAQFPAIMHINDLQPGQAVITKNWAYNSLVASSCPEEDTTTHKLLLIRSKGENREFAFKEVLPLLKAHLQSLLDHTEPTDEPTLLRLPEGLDAVWARKVLEATLAGTQIKVELSLPKLAQVGGFQGIKRVVNPRKQSASSNKALLTITNAGDETAPTFSEVLKKVRANTAPEQHGVVVEKIRETSNGQLRLLVKETRPGAREEFAAAVEAIGGLKADAKGALKKRKLVLHDIERDLTETQIQQYLLQAIGSQRTDDVQVDPPREDRFRRVSTIIYVRDDMAKWLLSQRTVKIGWTSAKVREWLSLPTCYRCRKIGHIARHCHEEAAVEQRCHYCASTAHSTKECQRDLQKCYLCDSDGHAANSMHCPIYKSRILELRAARLQPTRPALNQRTVETPEAKGAPQDVAGHQLASCELKGQPPADKSAKMATDQYGWQRVAYRRSNKGRKNTNSS